MIVCFLHLSFLCIAWARCLTRLEIIGIWWSITELNALSLSAEHTASKDRGCRIEIPRPASGTKEETELTSWSSMDCDQIQPLVECRCKLDYNLYSGFKVMPWYHELWKWCHWLWIMNWYNCAYNLEPYSDAGQYGIYTFLSSWNESMDYLIEQYTDVFDYNSLRNWSNGLDNGHIQLLYINVRLLR